MYTLGDTTDEKLQKPTETGRVGNVPSVIQSPPVWLYILGAVLFSAFLFPLRSPRRGNW